MWLNKGYSQYKIAKAFGVKRKVVGNINTGNTWSHLHLRDFLDAS